MLYLGNLNLWVLWKGDVYLGILSCRIMSFVERYVWWQGFGFNNVASYVWNVIKVD